MYKLCAHTICYLLVKRLRMIVKTLAAIGFQRKSVDFDQAHFLPIHRPNSPIHPGVKCRMTVVFSVGHFLNQQRFALKLFCGTLLL